MPRDEAGIQCVSETGSVYSVSHRRGRYTACLIDGVGIQRVPETGPGYSVSQRRGRYTACLEMRLVYSVSQRRGRYTLYSVSQR